MWSSVGWGQGLEDFTNSNATGSYSDNSFVGNDGITWTYVESRDGNGDANGSGIDLPALMLRWDDDPSSITSNTIPGGIGDFSVKLYKGFTGGGNRQVELFVNGISQGTSTPFDDFDEHIFEVNEIDIDGDIEISIVNITGKQVIIDDITWTGYTESSNDPDSYVDATGVTQPTGEAISSLDWDESSPTATPIFQFNIADAGTADGLPTEVTEITIKAGTNNTADWTEDIGGGYLYKESSGTQLTIDTDPDVQAGQVTFYIEDGELDVADGGSELVTLYIWPNSTTTDNVVFECMVDADNHGFKADPEGSVFTDDFGTDVIGNQFTIDVDATQLSFITQPADVYVGQTMSAVEVAATDINGNVDEDYADTEITLGFTGSGSMGGTAAVTTASGVAVFSDLSFDTEEAGVTLTADDGSFAQAESNTFDITTPPVVSLPYTRDFETGDLFTDGWSTQLVIGTIDWELTEYSGDHFAEMSNYSGGNQASETWLITPGIDLSGINHALFNFMNACNFSGPDIEVKISTDYDGFSEPSSATWNDLSPTLSTGSYDDVSSGDLDISDYTGGTAYIAFKYTGSDSDGKTWQIDDINIEQFLSDDASLETFTLGGEDVTGLTGLEVADPVNDAGATLYVDDFTGFEGIGIDATDAAATVTIELNGSVVDPDNYATQALADGDVIVATVEAEDGTTAYYKVTLTGENRELELIGPALPATYETGEDVTFTWNAVNIDSVNVYVVDTETHLINEEGAIDATLGTYTYTIANGDFGMFTIRITDASDETFLDETTEEVTIDDIQYPEGIEFYPEMGATDVPVDFTLSVLFDEDVVAGTGNFIIYDASDDSEVLNFTEADFSIEDDILTIEVEGLDYETEYYLLADAGIIEDLSGNATPVLDDPEEWTFTTMVEPETGLFFSEYIEGSSNNKAIEIYNPTGADVDLTPYVVKLASNGNEWGNTLDLTGTLEAGDVYVIANSSADQAILDVADVTSNVTYYDGNDALGLFKSDELIDAIGNQGESDYWDVAGVSEGLSEHTILRKTGITIGNPDWDASAGTNEEDSEWIVYDQDYIDDLGSHSTTLSDEAEILSFTFGAAIDSADAVIESGAATVDITVINGTDVTALVPTISISDGATIDPESDVEQDFTDPVVYTVTAEDGTTTKDWTVTVTESSTLSDKANIIEVELADVDSIKINDTDTIVTIYAPYGFDVTSVKPEFTVSAGATIADTADARDFTNPQVYEVTAQDETTVKNWEVSIVKTEPMELTIYDIQYTDESSGESPYLDELVKTSGIVTGVGGDGFFMQASEEEWNGIYVYAPDDNTATLGDSAWVIGTVDEYQEGTQISYVEDYIVIEQGVTLPDPIEITDLATTLTESHEGMLVKLIGVECTEGPSNYQEWTFADESGDEIMVDDILGYQHTFTIGAKYSITGLRQTYFGDKITPRDADDINETPVISDITLDPATPSSTDDVTISATITDDHTDVADLTVALFYGDSEGSEDTEVTFAQVETTEEFEGTIPASDAEVFYKITASDGELTSTSTGSYSVSTGINNPDGIVSMNVYPNPSNGEFTLEMNASKAGTFNVEIINIQGQVIYQKEISQDEFYRESIDISEKARGLYYIRITDGKNMKISKIMVQ